MLSIYRLARRFWAEAISTVYYLINRGPHTGNVCETPYEMWSVKPAD